jgi:ankyrin repeat protein
MYKVLAASSLPPAPPHRDKSSSALRPIDKKLIQACIWNDKKVENLIANGANVKGKDSHDMTPLHWACRCGTKKSVKTLLNAGAETRTIDRYGDTPFKSAITYNPMDIPPLLLEAEVTENSPISFVAVSHSEDILHLFLEAKITSNIMPFLLEANIDPNKRDKHGNTILHYAARYGYKEKAEALLRAGADRYAKNNDGETPIHWAASHNHIDVVSVLLGAENTQNIQDKHGNTPLHCAAKKGLHKLVSFLLGKGGDSDIKNKYGFTALDLAQATYQEALESLNNPQIKGSPGYIPAGKAFSSYYAPLISSKHYTRTQESDLLKTITTLLHQSLHFAARYGHKDIADRLLQAGKDPEKKDKMGHTPLQTAILFDQTHVIILFGSKLPQKVIDKNVKAILMAFEKEINKVYEGKSALTIDDIENMFKNFTRKISNPKDSEHSAKIYRLITLLAKANQWIKTNENEEPRINPPLDQHSPPEKQIDEDFTYEEMPPPPDDLGPPPPVQT